MPFPFVFFALFAFAGGYFLNNLANLPTLVLRYRIVREMETLQFVKLTVLNSFSIEQQHGHSH